MNSVNVVNLYTVISILLFSKVPYCFSARTALAKLLIGNKFMLVCKIKAAQISLYL